MKKIGITLLILTACGPSKNDQAQGPGTTFVTVSGNHAVLVSSVNADTNACPAGGKINSFGSDLNDNNTLDPEEVQYVDVVCNPDTSTVTNTETSVVTDTKTNVNTQTVTNTLTVTSIQTVTITQTNNCGNNGNGGGKNKQDN